MSLATDFLLRRDPEYLRFLKKIEERKLQREQEKANLTEN